MEWYGHPGDRPAAKRVARSRADRHGDDGGSLIEVLLSVGILGTVGVGILVALMAAIKGADRREQGVEIEARLVSAVELLHGDGVGYESCNGDPVAVADAYTMTLRSALPTADGISIEVTGVEFWDGTTLVSGCGSAPADTLQSVTIEASRRATVASAVVTKLPGTVIP